MIRYETLLRLTGFLPLVFITYQVIMLRRILISRAWTKLMLGFITFLLLSAATLFWTIAPEVRLGVALVGYILIARGFHRLRNDLLAVLHPKKYDSLKR